jgi:hypothetical protein
MLNKKGNMGNKPAERKQVEINTKNGKASNRRGIRYASREAGRAPEHFEQKNKGEAHTTRSRKAIENSGGKPRKKLREKRIVSG